MTTKPRTLEEATSLAEALAKSFGMRRAPASPAQINWPRATGHALSAIALDMYGMRRRWYERIPWFGDRWLRRRMKRATCWHASDFPGMRIVRAPAVLPDGSPCPEMPKEIGSISAKHEGAWKQQSVAKLLRRL